MAVSLCHPFRGGPCPSSWTPPLSSCAGKRCGGRVDPAREPVVLPGQVGNKSFLVPGVDIAGQGVYTGYHTERGTP